MASSVWRDAVIDDGCHVMYEATSRLYQGGLLRPDRYYQSKPGLGGYHGYRRTFDHYQQTVIETSGETTDYDIKEGAKAFDISLHWLVLQKLCHLESSSRLHKNLRNLASLRNQVAHPTRYNQVDDLNEKLTYLGALYDDILDDLEDETDDNLLIARQEVIRRINKRKSKAKTQESRWTTTRSYSQVPSTRKYNQPDAVDRSQRTEDDEDDELGNFGKAAVGIGMGGAIGMGLGTLAAFISTHREDKQKTQQEKNKPVYQGWGAMGAALGAGIGLVVAVANMDFSEDELQRRTTTGGPQNDTEELQRGYKGRQASTDL